jgi:hypothetical protein
MQIPVYVYRPDLTYSRDEHTHGPGSRLNLRDEHTHGSGSRLDLRDEHTHGPGSRLDLRDEHTHIADNFSKSIFRLDFDKRFLSTFPAYCLLFLLEVFLTELCS